MRVVKSSVRPGLKTGSVAIHKDHILAGAGGPEMEVLVIEQQGGGGFS